MRTHASRENFHRLLLELRQTKDDKELSHLFKQAKDLMQGWDTWMRTFQLEKVSCVTEIVEPRDQIIHTITEKEDVFYHRLIHLSFSLVENFGCFGRILSEKTFADWLKSPHNANLHTITLNEWDFSLFDMENLAHCNTFEKLKSLDLRWNRLTTLHYIELLQAPWMTHLQTLDISANRHKLNDDLRIKFNEKFPQLEIIE